MKMQKKKEKKEKKIQMKTFFIILFIAEYFN